MKKFVNGHIAESKEMIYEHEKLGKFSINTISKEKTIIDTTTSSCL